jgi:hypothetical protein
VKPSTAKAKGAATEQAFCDYLSAWVPHVERRHLSGAFDRGDIAGVPGVVFEVKSGARMALSTWLAELEVEMVNDGADTGAVVVRPKGKPRPEDWFAALPLPLYVQLLVDAGWIPEIEE